MSILIALLSTFSALSANAAELSCPNITGTYYAENDQINFHQVGCERLIRKSAARDSRNTGETVYGVTRDFELNGKPVLFDGNRGELAKLIDGAFEFSFNFKGGHRYTFAHGFCEVPKMIVVKKDDGNLEVTFQAEKCEDGFTGEVKTNWRRWTSSVSL